MAKGGGGRRARGAPQLVAAVAAADGGTEANDGRYDLRTIRIAAGKSGAAGFTEPGAKDRTGDGARGASTRASSWRE